MMKFDCESCGEQFESIIEDDDAATCPNCGAAVPPQSMQPTGTRAMPLPPFWHLLAIGAGVGAMAGALLGRSLSGPNSHKLLSGYLDSIVQEVGMWLGALAGVGLVYFLLRLLHWRSSRGSSAG